MELSNYVLALDLNNVTPEQDAQYKEKAQKIDQAYQIIIKQVNEQ